MNKKTLLALTIGAVLSHNALAQTISGVVLDKKGKPVAKAKVSLTGTNKMVLADENGLFTLSDIAPGTIELHVAAKNFSHFDKSYTLPEQGISNLNITLTPTVFDVIEVNATPLHSSTIESALPVDVISAGELRLKQASSLGETLKNEVGVNATYYGPVSSSPIIRGLDGPRVMITQNGLDAGDASRVGPDHAVSSDASTANQIEVLRGPATLFYGSGAIGGVVNVVDNRVPHSRDTTAEWQLEHGTVSNENVGSVNYNTAKDNIGIHVDGFWRKSDDFKLAGPALRFPEAGYVDTGKLNNSSSKSSGYTLGTSYLTDNGFYGVSAGRVNRQYDIPGEDGVYADMQQNRYQFISEQNFDDGFFSALNGKAAYTDYEHTEMEGGVPGTQFTNKSFEGRLDLHHNEYAGFGGAFSLHYKTNDFEALGEEAFTPPSTTEAIAVSMLEEKHFDDFLLQLGARIEHSTIDADSVELELGSTGTPQQVQFTQEKYNPISTSAGFIYNFTTGYNVALNASYSERAPSASEIFSYGPHIGAKSFEVGALFDVQNLGDGTFSVALQDRDINMEKSYNLDLTLRKFGGDLGFVFNLFYDKVNNFFYQRNTGISFDAEEDTLPILVFAQQDAKLYGYEAEVVYQANAGLKLTAFSDYIRGKLNDGENLPRIPPMRLGGRINYEGDKYGTELSVTHYRRQSDIGYLETETAGYTMVDMNFNYYLSSNNFGDLTLYLKGQNLTDVNARVHSSFLKDSVPLPGRGFTIGIRGGF